VDSSAGDRVAGTPPGSVDITRRMREEWNRRARQDAYFYAGFVRHNQADEEFLASGAETVAKIESELARLPELPCPARRALEIGCGPGRLMLPLSRHFGEIHGVDISEEMVALARERLRSVPHAHVQVTPGAGLPMFEAGYFDFVYSYIVFQHIPDRQVVLEYLREARRVLKPEGILCCQLRGAAPLASEMSRESATWTGSYFTGEEMAAFAREHDFHLVALSGLETQYMWTTWRKPAPAAAPRAQFVLKAVTATTNGGNIVPARGRDAAISLWIDGLPSDCHLGNLEIRFAVVPSRDSLPSRDREGASYDLRGCYLSPIGPSGDCQMDVRLPQGITPGAYQVALYCDERMLGAPQPIEVIPAPPRNPKLLSITDGVNLASHRRIESGGVKVTLEDIANPAEVSFRVAGRPAESLAWECRDPITDTYEFAFHLAHKTKPGRHSLEITVSGRRLPSEPIEVAPAGPRRALPWRRS